MDYNSLVSSLPDNIRNCHLLLIDFLNNPNKHHPHIQKFYYDMIATQRSSSSSFSSQNKLPSTLSGIDSFRQSTIIPSVNHNTHIDPFERSLGPWLTSSPDNSPDNSDDDVVSPNSSLCSRVFNSPDNSRVHRL